MKCRGYGESDKPPNRSDYELPALKKDIVELVSWKTGLSTNCNYVLLCVHCMSRFDDALTYNFVRGYMYMVTCISC